MKLFITSGYYFLLATLLITCRQADVDPNHVVDGSPSLKSISFSGIPQENSSIDQKTRVITVKMPASIPNDITITVELTDNAEWINKALDGRGGSLFSCDSCFHIYLKEKNLANQSVIDYRIKLVPSAPLQIGLLPAPLPYLIRNPNAIDLEIPMLNLYGNKLPRETRFIYDKTGEASSIKRDSTIRLLYPGQPRIRYSSYSNKLGIYLYDAKLVPGSYHVELLLDDGTLLKVPQPVLVTQGTPDIDYQSKNNFGYRVAVGKTLAIDGYNLFEGDITLDLLDRQDRVHPLSGLVFEPYGRQIQVPIPTALSPGQYAMRVWQNGTKLPYAYCLRVNVLKDEQDRPIIGTIGDDSAPCSLRDAVPVKRGVKVAFTANQTQQVLNLASQHVTLKLLSLTGTMFYYGTVAPYDYNRGWDVGASVTLSETIPAGLYTAVLQVLDAQNNVVSESEPYGRILDVK